MGQFLIRAGLFLSILMFGFILGILYSDQDVDLSSKSFAIKEVEEAEESEDKKGFILKESQTNIIEMEEDEGLVVYQEGDEEIHKSLEGELPSFIDKTNVPQSESSSLFSELGLRTAGAFEKVFQKMFSVVDGH